MRGLDYYSGLIYGGKATNLAHKAPYVAAVDMTRCSNSTEESPLAHVGSLSARETNSISQRKIPEGKKRIHLITPDHTTCSDLIALAENIRSKLPTLSTYVHTDSGNSNTNQKSAQKGADILIIQGEQEIREESHHKDTINGRAGCCREQRPST